MNRRMKINGKLYSTNYFEVSPYNNRSLRSRFASRSTVDVGPTANSCISSDLRGTPDRIGPVSKKKKQISRQGSSQ